MPAREHNATISYSCCADAFVIDVRLRSDYLPNSSAVRAAARHRVSNPLTIRRTLRITDESDVNVPIAGNEQMYEALRTLGVPTQLVVYRDQFHLFTRPSLIRDGMQRRIAWFDKFLAIENSAKSSDATTVPQ